MPYPNVKDKRVELKRLYNNEGVSRGLLSGDQWYSQQAFRALNQAVGRCLRHRNDHGAILLADERYLRDDMTRHLPKWLRPAMRKCAGFEDSRRGLRSFFAMHAREPPPVQPEEPAALKPSVAAGRSERKQRSSAAPKKTLAVDEEDEAGAGVGGDAKQKDIRSLFAPVGAATAGAPPSVPRAPDSDHARGGRGRAARRRAASVASRSDATPVCGDDNRRAHRTTADADGSKTELLRRFGSRAAGALVGTPRRP